MVLPSEERLRLLAKLREKADKSTAKHKLYYRAKNHVYPVFSIDLDWLIYNRHNGRLESNMLTWMMEHAVSNDGEQYDESLHSTIEKFLWDQSKQRNKNTLIDLKKKGQQQPGIVTLDGVIIDGNRRAMLLRRLEDEKKEKQFFEAIILPDAYGDSEKDIVRLETQYQLGEDAKLDYGPLEKYLHVKRLLSLRIEEPEIAQLMSVSEPKVTHLNEIMELMDDYLEHIGSPGFYNMLKEDDNSTKEGMFVDLYDDIKRLKAEKGQVDWAYKDNDVLDLQTIQFDLIRYGRLADQQKSYRSVSHSSGKKCFFSNEEIWKKYSDNHHKLVDSVTEELSDLDSYMSRHPEFADRETAMRAMNNEWTEAVHAHIRQNFGICEDKLEPLIEQLEPKRLLERALNSLDRISYDLDSFVEEKSNLDLVKKINALSFEMKKRFERS